MAASGWTIERVELVKSLYGSGVSASEISRRLGGGITRNAVIGVAHRLGLTGRKAPALPGSVKERRAPSRAQAAPQTAAQPPAQPTPPPAPPIAVSQPVIPLSTRVTIAELRHASCRWPLGDPATPEFRFCGARRATPGLPYCGEHCRLAYQPASERRSRRAA